MRTILSYSGPDAAESRHALAAMIRSKVTDFDVDIDIEADGEVRAVAHKGLDQPITFLRGLNGSGISCRRSWHHIRQRMASVRLLYFILQGEMQVSNSGGSYAVKAGRCAIINADEPFYTCSMIGASGDFECALAVVPEQLVLSHMPWANRINTSFEIGGGCHTVVTSLLDVLCFEGEHLSQKTAESLTTAFLQSISESIGDEYLGAEQPSSLSEKRFADIQAFIQKYLTCTDLSCDRVAADCGISPRYLCYVLKANDTSFSSLLWSQRLLKAREWLVSKSFQRYPIHNIAHMAGFKSAAHFSRMFKSTYDLSPKEFRETHSAEQTEAGSRAARGHVQRERQPPAYV